MPLILRAVKGSKLTISEMDGNLLWLSENISGSGVIPVTGSGIDASNTPITSSFFVGDGSKVTGVISSSYAVTASYSTTLGAALGNDATGQLRLLNSANSTLSVISKLTSSLAVTSSYAFTASYVNPLRQIVQITGSLLVSNSIDSSNRLLLSNNSVDSLNWEGRVLLDNGGNQSIDWRNRYLLDGAESTSIEWENRVLYNSAGEGIIDWENNTLKSTSANSVAEWGFNIFRPSTDDSVNLGDSGNRWRSAYVSRTFIVGDPIGAKTTIANFTRDGVSDYVGSITLSTGSGAPTIAGGEGQMFVGKAGANYYIYVYIGGQWRSSSLA